MVEGNPHHTVGMHFTSPDGRLSAGMSTSTPGKWHAFTDKDEYCYILSDHCALIHEDGTRWASARHIVEPKKAAPNRATFFVDKQKL